MKILTMCQDIKRGGFYERYLSLIEAMLERGWEVHYISTQRFPIKNKKLRSRLHFHSVRRVSGIRAPFFAKFMPQALAKALALAKKERFDSMVVFGSAYGFIGWSLKRIYNLPLITFIRADLLENLKIQGRSRLLKPVSVMQRLAFRASERIVVPSSIVGERIQRRYRIPKEKMLLIYNDIPLDFRKPARVKRGDDIGFVGVTEKRKGIDTLLRSYASIRDRVKGKLIIVGDGPLQDKLKLKAREKMLEDRVEFLGWKDRNQTKRLMSSFSLFVAPSLSEGCPNTVLEALGCNTPCIGSDIPEIREVLKHDELLFRPEDTEDMAKRILYALENQEGIKKLCSERRGKFLFNWKRACIEAIESIHK